MNAFLGIFLTTAGLAAAVLLATACAPPAPLPNIEATVEAAVQTAVDAALATRIPPNTPQIQATLTHQPSSTHPESLQPPSDSPQPSPPTPSGVQPGAGPNIANMVAQAKPSVVRIEAGRGNASGFVFETQPASESALVLTNFHVVDGYPDVQVTVDDSVTYPGQVLGIDRQRDLAVVRICCGRFQALHFGDAATLGAGAEVVAMGYPLGIPGGATVTKGIVSANRFDGHDQRWVIQTDASINPGSSGGPLLTVDGSVIGINSFKRVASTAGRPVEGVAFAISEVTVRELLPTLKTGRYALPPTPTPQPRWETYVNTTHRYRFSSPNTWRWESDDQGYLYGKSPDQQARVSILGPYRGYSSVDALAKAQFAHMDSLSPNLLEPNRIGRATYGLPPIEAIRRDFRWQLDPDSCIEQAIQFITLAPSGGYVVDAAVCEDTAAHHRNAIEFILSSFDP